MLSNRLHAGDQDHDDPGAQGVGRRGLSASRSDILFLSNFGIMAEGFLIFPTRFFVDFSFAASRWHAEQCFLNRTSPLPPDMGTPAMPALLFETNEIRAIRVNNNTIFFTIRFLVIQLNSVTTCNCINLFNTADAFRHDS